MSKGGSVGLIVSGAICGIGGIAAYLVGNEFKSDYKRQLSSLFSSGKSDNTGEIISTVGIALAVIGVLLIIIGIIAYFTSNSTSNKLGLEGSYISSTTNNRIVFYTNGKCTLTKSGVTINGKFKRVSFDYWIVNFGSVSADIKLNETSLEIRGGSYNDVFTRI